MSRQVEFLAELQAELAETFPGELGDNLFGIAASEFLTGPNGVNAMFEKAQRFTSKTDR